VIHLRRERISTSTSPLSLETDADLFHLLLPSSSSPSFQLGIESWLKDNGHELVVTTDKEGPGSVFQKELLTADVLISTPFHPVSFNLRSLFPSSLFVF
jgi:hypothetical protein